MAPSMHENSENINNLISEMKKGNCVAFIGAGVSAPATHTWAELLDKLKNTEKVKELNLDDQLTQLLKKKHDETGLFDREAAAEIIQSGLKKDDFIAELKEALNREDPTGEKVERVKKRYELIMEMPFHSLITTNFDTHLQGETLDNADFIQLLRKPFRGWIDSIKNPKRLNDFIIKLHGDVEKGSASIPLVFSRSGYRELLFETPNYQSLIRTILATKVVVFVGFSFSDPYLNLIRSEVLSMLKSNSQNEIVAYAIMNDLSCHQVDYLKKHEGIAAIRYDSGDDHEEFDQILCEIHKKTRPDELLSRVLNDKTILWFDQHQENNAHGIDRLNELWGRRRKKCLIQETELEDAKKTLETDKSIDLLITHWGHKIENGEKQSNAITLARHIRKKEIQVPIIVFAGGEHATENRPKALKFGAFDYVYEWHDLFSRIEDLFKDPVKDH